LDARRAERLTLIVMSGLLRFAARTRAMPWLAVVDAARRIYRHGKLGWQELSSAEQRELGRLVRLSRRGPSALPPRDRVELRRLVLKALKGAALPGRRR
jgi:hypothetical protein